MDELASLLVSLRALPGLVERRPGIFYCKGRAYLHFHEDPAGLFADLRLTGTHFERFALATVAQRAAFLRAVKANGLART